MLDNRLAVNIIWEVAHVTNVRCVLLTGKNCVITKVYSYTKIVTNSFVTTSYNLYNCHFVEVPVV